MKTKMAISILLTSLFAQADAPSDLMTSLVAAQTLAQSAMTAGQSQPSILLQGTWTLTKRMCVSAFSQEAFNNPTQSFDMTYYYNVINYGGINEIFTTTNADRLNDHCVSQATGELSMSPVDLSSGGLHIDEVIVLKTLTRKKVNCADTYKGPSLAKAFNVVKIDEDTAYFFLLPGQFPGSAFNCTNPNDFNVELAVRVPDVK